MNKMKKGDKWLLYQVIGFLIAVIFVVETALNHELLHCIGALLTCGNGQILFFGYNGGLMEYRGGIDWVVRYAPYIFCVPAAALVWVFFSKIELDAIGYCLGLALWEQSIVLRGTGSEDGISNDTFIFFINLLMIAGFMYLYIRFYWKRRFYGRADRTGGLGKTNKNMKQVCKNPENNCYEK